jgi:hypothetical protein
MQRLFLLSTPGRPWKNWRKKPEVAPSWKRSGQGTKMLSEPARQSIQQPLPASPFLCRCNLWFLANFSRALIFFFVTFFASRQKKVNRDFRDCCFNKTFTQKTLLHYT